MRDAILHGGTFCSSSPTYHLSILGAGEILGKSWNSLKFMAILQQELWVQTPHLGSSRSHPLISPETGPQAPADILLCTQMHWGPNRYRYIYINLYFFLQVHGYYFWVFKCWKQCQEKNFLPEKYCDG